jgi:membrane associated rhomboid family serine protease
MSGRAPILTIIAVTGALAAAAVQYTVPAAVPALQRDPSALRHGEVWRLVTPLLVQTLGWYQVAANLATLVVVGLATERVLGGWRWAALFTAGAAGGQFAAYAWHEPGGGDSIAICGLAGGLAVALLADRTKPPRLAADTVVYYVVALTGWGLRGAVAAGVACMAAAVGIYGLRRAGMPGVHRLALACTVVCALGLATLRDLHGASLTAGMALMAALVVAARLRPYAGLDRSNVDETSRA